MSVFKLTVVARWHGFMAWLSGRDADAEDTNPFNPDNWVARERDT